MKKKRGYLLVPLALLLVLTLVTTAFGIDEGDVQSAVTESSKEEVAGNIFIWFLCAIGFLKISQKIDSFMAAIGINTARTGGSMLAELMIAGRSIAGAAGHSLGGMFHHGGSAFGGAAKTPAAGSAYVSNQFGHGVIGMAQQAAANKATAATTERASGLSGAVGNKMFQSSLQNGGQFATDVTHSVAMGNINQMGTMTGATAEAALAGYMGYTAAAMDEGNTFIEEADNVENGVNLNGGDAGAQPPVQGTVPRTPAQKPGETGVPPVKPTGTDVGNATARSPGGSHGNVIPVVPAGSVGTSFTPANLQGGAASPYTPMGMDAGATIPREPMEMTQTESATDTEMGSTPVAAPSGVVMNNTPESKAFQQKMQFASVVGMDGGAESGTVPGGNPTAVGTGMKTEAVMGESIPPSVAGIQEETPDQSTTSGGVPVVPVPNGRMSGTATGVQRIPSEPYQKASIVGDSAITAKPEGSVTDVKNAGQMASASIEREPASSPVFDRDNGGQQVVARETAVTSGSMSQTATISMAPGGTAETRQTMAQAQSITQSSVDAPAAVHELEKSGTIQGMDIPRAAARPVAGGEVTATTATEAVAKQSSNPVPQAEKPDGHAIPTTPGGVAIISTGATTGSKMQASAADTDVVPQMGVTGSAGTIKTSRTTDHNASGNQTFPYQNPTGSVVQSSISSNMVSGASGETTIQMQSTGVNSSGGMSPMPTTGMAGRAVTSQVQSISTEAKTNTERVGEPGRQNSQPVPTNGIPTEGVSPQASVKNSSAAATKMSTGSLKEATIPTAMPTGVGRMDMQEHTPVSRGVDPQQGMNQRATNEAVVRSSPVPGRTPADGKLDTAPAMQQSPVSNHTGAENITRTPTVGLGTTPAVEKPTTNHSPVQHEGIAGKAVQNSVPAYPAVNAQGKPKGSQVTNTNKTIEKVTPGKTEHPGIQREVTKPAVDGQKQSPVPPNVPTSLHHERPTQADNRQSGTSVPPKVQPSTPPTPRVQTGSTTGKVEPPHRVPEVKTGKKPSMPVSVPGTANTMQKPPTYTKVEIGGGRITGVETPAGGGKSRPFAMYSTKQYTQPKGPHEVVKTVDGESWYKQYAQPAVQKTPKEVTEKGIKYDQQIVDQLPDAPRRKDRI